MHSSLKERKREGREKERIKKKEEGGEREKGREWEVDKGIPIPHNTTKNLSKVKLKFEKKDYI